MLIDHPSTGVPQGAPAPPAPLPTAPPWTRVVALCLAAPLASLAIATAARCSAEDDEGALERERENVTLARLTHEALRSSCYPVVTHPPCPFAPQALGEASWIHRRGDELQTVDAWGQPLMVRCEAHDADWYVIVQSSGADLRMGTQDDQRKLCLVHSRSESRESTLPPR